MITSLFLNLDQLFSVIAIFSSDALTLPIIPQESRILSPGLTLKRPVHVPVETTEPALSPPLLLC